MALVEGESGIGKSRLVQELLEAVQSEGAVVLSGRCYEDEAGLAFGPVGDLLRDRLREDDDWLTRAGEGILTEAARLLPEGWSGPSACGLRVRSTSRVRKGISWRPCGTS